MKNLIIGNGQIGSALKEIFSKHHETYVRDIGPFDFDASGLEILHIAYPYSDKFIDATLAYIQTYKPFLTIIHSSVAIGTTAKLGPGVVHSPERGRYPNLAYEMKRYVKYIGSDNWNDCKKAMEFFSACEWPTKVLNSSSATEAFKLISNVHMGVEVCWKNEVIGMLSQIDVKMNDYEEWEDSYNAGYFAMNQTQLMRPRMNFGPIGGHCIIPCTEILEKRFNSRFFEIIYDYSKN
jgi:hypothetical protein